MNLTTQKAKVFQYGSPARTRAEGDALDQLRLQNRFWNDLVEIDHEFNRRYHELIDGYDEKIKSLTEKDKEFENQIETLNQQIRNKRKAARSGKVNIDALGEEKAALKAKRQPIKEELKQYRQEIKIKVKPQQHALEAERGARVKSLRQQYSSQGLYWGNYNAVEQSYDTARSMIMKERAHFFAKPNKLPGEKPPELRFHRFDGAGRWTCQIQNGMTVAQAFAGADNRFQIDPVAPEAWSQPSRAERRRLSRTAARIRIGSTEERQPRWLEIPIVMHRPIPEERPDQIRIHQRQEARQSPQLVPQCHRRNQLPSYGYRPHRKGGCP